MALKRAVLMQSTGEQRENLTAEAVQSAALSLQCVDNVHSCDGLPLSVLSVSDGVSDHVLKEYLKYAASLFVDETGDTLHTTTASQTPDSRLGYALDVVAENFPVPLSAAFAQSFTSLTTAGHVYLLADRRVMKMARQNISYL